MVDRADECRCLSSGHQIGKKQHYHSDRRHCQKECECGVRNAADRHGNTENISVIQADSTVEHIQPDRVGPSDVLPGSILQGSLYLRPLQVILKCEFILLCIIMNISVGIDQRDSGSLLHVIQLPEIILPGNVDCSRRILRNTLDAVSGKASYSYINEENGDRIRYRKRNSDHHKHALLNFSSHASGSHISPKSLFPDFPVLQNPECGFSGCYVRIRYPTPRTVSILSPACPSF